MRSHTLHFSIRPIIFVIAFAAICADALTLRPRATDAAPTAAAPIALHLSVEKQDHQSPLQWAALTGAVQPGDALRYTVLVRNRNATAVKNIVVTEPIPAGMIYKAASATDDPTYSLDGKAFSAQPMISVPQPDGTIKTKPASPDAYRALRWRVAEVAASSSQTVTYQVKVR